MRTLSLGLVLFAFWLALSGHYTPFLISVGGVCVVFCLWIAQRMQVLDPEGHPIGMLPGTLTYYPWLAFEILKSSLAVAKIILAPSLPISPTMTTVTARQKTPVGIATFGNSITLTPSTLTTGISGNEITIHALTREAANDVQSARMNSRVTQFEGRT
ncbi:MAG: Na+/H+ antiporter subunit E [Alphaproteobacteria bacterium]|nr:Na+/H+ antiporter subunit E [Alphaproteobacteria bacterium]